MGHKTRTWTVAGGQRTETAQRWPCRLALTRRRRASIQTRVADFVSKRRRSGGCRDAYKEDRVCSCWSTKPSTSNCCPVLACPHRPCFSWVGRSRQTSESKLDVSKTIFADCFSHWSRGEDAGSPGDYLHLVIRPSSCTRLTALEANLETNQYISVSLLHLLVMNGGEPMTKNLVT